MLKGNIFRYGTDEFDYSGYKAFLVSNEALDCTGQTNVDKFVITGAQPTDTDRRVIFKIDGTLWKFKNSNLVAYSGEGEYEDVIANGNTVAELTALNDIPAFVGKRVYPIIALKRGWTATASPSIKISLNVRDINEKYEATHWANAQKLVVDDPDITPRIADIVADYSVTGNATCEVFVRLLGADGTWSDYMPIIDAAGKNATQLDFKIVRTVTKLDGTDTSICNSATVRYNTGGTAVSGNYADLYSKVQDYGNDLQTCYLVIRHTKLIDSTITAYVNFMTPPKSREYINIGTASGARKDFILGVNNVKDTGIDPASIRIFADGQPFLDFDYNVEVSTVTLTAPNGQAITASYDYGRSSETWLQMTRDGEPQIYPDDGTYMSRYTYTLSDANAVGKTISNIRLKLTRPTGTVKNYSLGVATGKTQMFVLPHAADQSSVKLAGLTDDNFTYDEDSQILTVAAPKNTALTLGYTWIGEQIHINSLASGWVARI